MAITDNAVEDDEDLDGDRTALGRAQQPEDDLQRALLAVAAVPVLGQRAVRALHVAGGQVVEHQRVLAKMPLGEPLLDGGLPLDQPVHRRVELMLIDVAESEQFAQGGYRALGGQRAVVCRVIRRQTTLCRGSVSSLHTVPNRTLGFHDAGKVYRKLCVVPT